MKQSKKQIPKFINVNNIDMLLFGISIKMYFYIICSKETDKYKKASNKLCKLPCTQVF